MVELLVSISIVVIITAVIMVQQVSFNSAVLIRSQAYKIALDARQTQLSAVSVTGQSSSQTADFRALFGLHFDLSNDQQYKIFRDGDSDGFYDASEAVGKQGVLDKRFEVRALRVHTNSNTILTPTNVSVVFERPNFDARFFSSTGEIAASSLEIDIAKKDVAEGAVDIIKTIEITATGQIGVQ
jgi:type II secretory pathway pseudopilin PulG